METTEAELVESRQAEERLKLQHEANIEELIINVCASVTQKLVWQARPSLFPHVKEKASPFSLIQGSSSPDFSEA